MWLKSNQFKKARLETKIINQMDKSVSDHKYPLLNATTSGKTSGQYSTMSGTHDDNISGYRIDV